MFRNASKSLTTSNEVYEYALSLLDRREHGEKELVQKLRRRCSSSELIRETVAKLKEYDLLNEERYARRVFESWRSRKVYGRLHLQAELLKKQVGEAYIPAILAMLSEEEEMQRVRAAYRQIAGRQKIRLRDGKRRGCAGAVFLCQRIRAIHDSSGPGPGEGRSHVKGSGIVRV